MPCFCDTIVGPPVDIESEGHGHEYAAGTGTLSAACAPTMPRFKGDIPVRLFAQPCHCADVHRRALVGKGLIDLFKGREKQRIIK